jgi:pyruvate,water dikinase
MTTDVNMNPRQSQARDPLMGESRPDWYWTTVNSGEAMPGVMTPLGWTFWGPSCERAARGSAFRIGALTRAEGAVPRREDWYQQVFYGRVALRLDFMSTIGDRMPGTTGRDALRSLFGELPDGMEFQPTRRRYPIVAWRLPALFIRFPRHLAAVSAEIDAWWKESVARSDQLDHGQTTSLLAEAAERHKRAMAVQCDGILSSMQPLYDAVAGLVSQAGAGDLSLLTTPSGGAEFAMVRDIWRASRNEIPVSEVVREHGFHGPHEGEISSRVWREDDSPLRRMIEQYAERDDSHDPRLHEAQRSARYQREVQALLAALPRGQRPVAGLILKLAGQRLPLRGVGKRSFLQANDVGRACARRLGSRLAREGVLAHPDDIFYLTLDEVMAARPPSDARDLVATRRERRSQYERMTLPDKWRGTPTPIPIVPPAADGSAAALRPGDVVRGSGVSRGVVEGQVRVVTDPSFAEVGPDEILVAPVTDPSWSSIMFISSGLVVDIGGALSHAAVVARELDIPCVVGTQNGTQVLRNGDRVLVDGEAGTVKLLARDGAAE